ncbi:hypothetical protein ABV23_RS01110 [Escherichia coli]|nr:hypothetical protein [Escherichia coli]
MNLVKFNPKNAERMFNTNNLFNIMLNDGTVQIGVALLAFEGEKLNTIYKFSNLDGDFWELHEVDKVCTHFVYELQEVGAGWALTRNGSRVFPGNVYGVIENKEYAEHYLHNLNRNASIYTPDTIKVNDIVLYTDYNNFTHKAIVTAVRKPKDAFDHGTIEVYMVGGEKQYFDHFTYTGWDTFLEVIEEY